MIPAVGALLGLTVAVTACGASARGVAAGSRSSPTAVGKTMTPSSSRPATPAPPSTGSTRSSSLTSAPDHPGVVADCTSAPPYRLSVMPSSIALACADNGLGVEKMYWDSWTASTATGQGTFWEKLCQPNCAQGKIGTYPVAVTLSAVHASPEGPWFSRLTIKWKGSRPPGTVPNIFSLTPPSS